MKPASRAARIVLVIGTMSIVAILASRLLSPLDRARGFLVPSAREAGQAREAFAAILTDAAAAPPAGLRLTQGEDIRVLAEAAEDCRGRGTYLVRDSAAAPLAILAPHRGSDLDTGTLAAALFDDGIGRAAAWNSAPRRGKDTCPGGDPTRHATHHLTAFSLAFAQTHPQGRIVQLHGFDGRKRDSRAARLADIIVSEGSETPGERLYDLADCLSRSLHPWRVAVYPGDVRELGALRNRQGRALREIGFAGFAHLEMARPVRRALVEDADRRRRFARCLETGLA